MDTIIGRALHNRPLALIAVLWLVPRLVSAAPDIALQMTVDTAVPTVGQTVEFTITASNVGTDAASGVEVTDHLPAGLRIPTGLAAFPSTGTYDAATGAWSIGSLPSGGSATLVIPAVVAVTPQPPCIVNVAESSIDLDANAANNRAVAAVRQDVADRCVDLQVASGNLSQTGCDGSIIVEYYVTVSNAGPDDARNVYVDLTQTPVVAPNLHFTGAGCSASRCTFAMFSAGTSQTIRAVSDVFSNDKNRAVTFDVAISSGDVDYSTANNQWHDATTIAKAASCGIDVDEGWSGVAAAGMCFIATAAYGSPLEPHVMALREFRDRHLQHTELGRAFVRFYYRHSPPIAAVIGRHESLRFLVRMLLTPVVLTIAFPLRAVGLLALALGFVFAWLHRARRRAARATT